MRDRSKPSTEWDGISDFFTCNPKHDQLTAKNDGVLSWTSEMRPESIIYTPKQDDKHPIPFKWEFLNPQGKYYTYENNSHAF